MQNMRSCVERRERTRTASEEEEAQIYHYANGSDSPAWIDEGEGQWTRYLGGIGANAMEEGATGDVTLQLANMHGDIVATASSSPEATALVASQRFDEYGNPLQSGALTGGDEEYGWLGVQGRWTQLPSGVVQMGVRSYVPKLGRFLSPDPVFGGSANAYEYAAGDPVNNFDLTGEKCHGKTRARCLKQLRNARRTVRRQIRIVRMRIREERAARANASVVFPGGKHVVFPWERVADQAIDRAQSALTWFVDPPSCSKSSLFAGGAAIYIDRRAAKVTGAATRVGRSLSKLSTGLAFTSLALGGMSELGWC